MEQNIAAAFVTIFATVFLAELGDKTQLATILFASEENREPTFVFVAAGLALLLSTAIAVFLGAIAENWLTFVPLKLVAGISFVLIGVWTITEHYTNA